MFCTLQVGLARFTAPIFPPASFISHIRWFPSSAFQMMSELPSSLKSAIPFTLQVGLARLIAPTLLVPSISHIIWFPSSAFQTTSELPSALKSPVFCTLQVGLARFTAPIFPPASFISHIRWFPSSAFQMMSELLSSLKSPLSATNPCVNINMLITIPNMKNFFIISPYLLI